MSVDMTARPVGVLVVDDKPVFRRAAKAVVDAATGFALVGEATSARQALAAVEELRPDLVLIEVRLRGPGGIETARRLAKTHPATVVVLLSVDGALSLPADVGRCGAADLVRKQDLRPAMLRDLWRLHRPSGP
jgi:two-component system, NarL family, invasion response regulator UvrY